MTQTQALSSASFGSTEQDVTPEMLIARAVALRPQLRERQGETDDLGHYPPSTHQDFLDAGLYKILHPRRFGGFEFGVDTFYRVVMEIARGCPSTAWCFALASQHQTTPASFLPEEAQEEVFGDGRLFLAPSTYFMPEKVERVEGGYYVGGQIRYCSGSPYATYYLGQAVLPDTGERVMFLAARSIWERLDDWGTVLGMRGSGSNSIVLDGVVPDRFIIHTTIDNPDVDGGTVGSRLHGNPMYALPHTALWGGGIACAAIGAAWAALDEYVELMKKQPMPIRLSDSTFFDDEGSRPARFRTEDVDAQRIIGGARSELSSAEAIVVRTGQRLMEYAQRNVEEGAFPFEWDLELASMFGVAGKLAWQATQSSLLRTCGSSAIVRPGQRMNRYTRDLATFWSHPLNAMSEEFSVVLGRMQMGVWGA